MKLDLNDLLSYAKMVLDERDTWASVENFIDRNDDFVLWGAGSGGYEAKRAIEEKGKSIAYFVDSDIRKKGMVIGGKCVKHPSEISRIQNKVIISSHWFIEIARYLMQRFGLRFMEDFAYRPESLFRDGTGFRFVSCLEHNIDSFSEVLSILDDQASRETFYRVLKYRLFCFRPYLMGAQDLPFNSDSNRPFFSGRPYHYRNLVQPCPGDTVLDCGAFTGDNSVEFAEDVGMTGKVYAFEPCPRTFQCLKENILSLGLNGIVVPVMAAVSRVSGQLRFEMGDNPLGSRLAETGDIVVESVSLDDFVVEKEIKEVQFVKMDIEGAEMDALLGAKCTIKEYAPKMAICIYHQPGHLFLVPLLIKSLNKKYSLFVKHNSVFFNETCLFARCGG